MEACAACGFEYRLDDAVLAGPAILAGATTLAALLRDADRPADLRSRRAPERWSPLEYGCHVRDVLLVQRERVLLARRVECPSFEPMGRDERVDHDGYAEQDPAHVARQLAVHGRLVDPAEVIDKLLAVTLDDIHENVARMVAGPCARATIGMPAARAA